MKFTFNGIVFSISFRHDKSRLIADHFAHQVVIGPFGKEGQLQRYGLFCETCCYMEIGPVPKAIRERKTHCRISAHINGDWVEVFAGIGNPNEEEGDRFCKEIGRRASLANALSRGNWFTGVGSGYVETPHQWPDSRLESLSNLRATFKQAAWKCFNERKGKNGN